MKQRTKGLIEAHTATILISFSGIFAKLIEQTPQITILIRSLLAFSVMFAFVKLRRLSFTSFSKKDHLILIFLGVLLAVHWVTLFHAIQISSVAVGIISLFTFPVITALVEPLINSKKYEKNNIIAGVAVLFGVVLVVPEWNLENSITSGVFWGIISAISYSIRNILSAQYVKKFPSESVMSYQLLIVGLSLLPFLVSWDFLISGKDLLYLFILAVGMTAVAHTLFIKSMASLNVHTSSIIISLQPLYSTLYAAVLLSEFPQQRTLIGGLIIFLTVIVEMRRQQRSLQTQAAFNE